MHWLCAKEELRPKISSELRRPTVNRDALRAHLLRVGAAGIADHDSPRTRAQILAWELPSLHPRRRGKDDDPGLIRRLEPDKTMRMLIARLHDSPLELKHLVRVITAPSVMRGYTTDCG